MKNKFFRKGSEEENSKPEKGLTENYSDEPFSFNKNNKRRCSKMVIVKQETEQKVMTTKQEKLIYQLLQSRVFSKKEFESFYSKIKKQIVTSVDASICLTYLLSVIKFRKRFTSKKQRAKAFCYICKSRENLTRYAELPDLKQKYYCTACEDDLDHLSVMYPLKETIKQYDYLDDAYDRNKDNEATETLND